MKKKLYFNNKINNDIDFYIEIHGGKIRNFKGYNMHNTMIEALLNGGIVENGEIRLLDIETKSDFTLEKITKYDKNKFGIKANYRINSKEISQYILSGAYIKLCLLEKILINFSKKETVFHEVKIKQLIIIGLFVTLPIGLLIAYLSKLNVLEENSPNPNLKITNQDSIEAVKKASPVSTKDIKLDRDSLSRK